MARVRFAASAALTLFMVLGLSARGPSRAAALLEAAAAAATSWPASSALVIAEVVTGGVSASDEFVELYNASTSSVDLAGLEVAYVTSSGATVTRKAAWTGSVTVEAGRHVLLANALGVHAGAADATWSGGLAATGGTLVLRPIGSEPLDAVGWGDAANAFVEGTAATAPAAGTSIERLPGGTFGNGTDTNDNASDLVVNAAPVPQGLAADPLPTPAPTPTPTPLPTPAPTPTPTPLPTPAPTPTPTPTPLPTPAPTPTPTPLPTPAPTPTPTQTPDPLLPIEALRALPNGAVVSTEGVLTTDLGAFEGGLAGFVQDATGGVAIHLDVPLVPPLPAGTVVRLYGTLDERYALRVLRVVAADVVATGSSSLPEPVPAATGQAAEPLEGRRIVLAGTVTETPTAMADGLGLMLDDGTGPIRVIVGPVALGAVAPRTGDRVTATGPLGQRDSSGTGLAGYRLQVTLAGELTVLPPPTPSHTPSPTPSPDPTPTPSANPSPSVEPSATVTPSASPSPSVGPTHSPTPTPIPTAVTVAAARLVAPGSTVVIRGVVVAEAGRLGTPPLFAIDDTTGGIVIHLADGQAAPPRGTLVEVRGAIAAPYGQTEIRPTLTGLSILGIGALPVPMALEVGAAGETVEGRLVVVTGTITTSASKATSGDLSLTITGEDGATLRVMADRSAGLDAAILRKGVTGTFTGIVGQRASRKGALDGYRVWLRDRVDVVLVPAGSASPTASPSAGSSAGASAAAPLVTIAAARVREGREVTVEGILTVDTTLLDASARRTIVEDATGAIEVYLAAPDAAVKAGRRVRVTGTVGRAWGAPRLRADEVRVLGERAPTAHSLTIAPGAATEWRLVRVRGTIVDVHRSGDRWQAELQVGRIRILMAGLPGSGIAAAAVTKGRTATVTGIVKRPYPTATDRRYAVLPRRPSDLVLGAEAAASPGSAAAGGTGQGRGGTAEVPLADGAPAHAPDVDLADLAAHAGREVHVGGLVTAVEEGGIRLDDGTATARIVLAAAAADLLAVLRPGDAVNATGVVETGDAARNETVVVVSDPSSVALLGDLGSPDDPGAAAGDAVLEVGPGLASLPAGAAAAASAVSGIERGTGLGAAPAGMVTLGLTGLIAGAAALVRRRRSERLFRSRIVARLDAIVGPGTHPANPAGDVPA